LINYVKRNEQDVKEILTDTHIKAEKTESLFKSLEIRNTAHSAVTLSKTG